MEDKQLEIYKEEVIEKPYFNGMGEPLPWEEEMAKKWKAKYDYVTRNTIY